jgi:tRNA (cytosine34-C5)-methyltransferase
MRILPHQQDTGGFFVAVLEKLKPLPWENDLNPNDSNSKFNTINIINEESALIKEEQSNQLRTKNSDLEFQKIRLGLQKKHRRILQGYREDPFVFFKNENEDVWPSIKYDYL